LDKKFLKWFIIERAKSFYYEITITDKCTFSEGWLRNFKEPVVEGVVQLNTAVIGCSPSIGAAIKYQISSVKP
jgi:hypothetical protein